MAVDESSTAGNERWSAYAMDEDDGTLFGYGRLLFT